MYADNWGCLNHGIHNHGSYLIFKGHSVSHVEKIVKDACTIKLIQLCYKTIWSLKPHSPSTTSHSSSAISSPLVRKLNQPNSARLINPLPSRSHISNMSPRASLERDTAYVRIEKWPPHWNITDDYHTFRNTENLRGSEHKLTWMR